MFAVSDPREEALARIVVESFGAAVGEDPATYLGIAADYAIRCPPETARMLRDATGVEDPKALLDRGQSGRGRAGR